MTNSTALEPAVPVFVLFGFDEKLAGEMRSCWERDSEAIAIFYGGAAGETAALKTWWNEEVESSGDWPRKILVLGGKQEDPAFAVDFLSTMAFIRPHTRFDLHVLCHRCTAFGEKTAQKYKHRKFLGKVESLKLANVQIKAKSQDAANFSEE
jgi:hypothetical protein